MCYKHLLPNFLLKLLILSITIASIQNAIAMNKENNNNIGKSPERKRDSKKNLINILSKNICSLAFQGDIEALANGLVLLAEHSININDLRYSGRVKMKVQLSNNRTGSIGCSIEQGTPLMLAARSLSPCAIDTIKLLIENNNNINVQSDANNFTALQWAIADELFDNAQALLEAHYTELLKQSSETIEAFFMECAKLFIPQKLIPQLLIKIKQPTFTVKLINRLATKTISYIRNIEIEIPARSKLISKLFDEHTQKRIVIDLL